MICIKPSIKSDYRNPLGHTTMEYLLELYNNPELQQDFHKNFKIIENPCPPKNLLSADIVCFHCKECYEFAIQKAKEKERREKKKNKIKKIKEE